MPEYDHNAARKFAVDVVSTLRSAGFEALWAGGCVRDELLGLTPKDYDVATSAEPEQIRQVFGKRRTLPIGQAFGVITVLGPKEAGPIEVATFRCDAKYTDGRHPDAVTFSTAEEDALRRDFTVNGLFYDPLEERVIDYVEGRQDLLRGVLRAIGDPYARIAEDKLRMLRAVRMAATFDLKMDPDTLAAVQQKAPEIVVVSPERITSELRRMLAHTHRRRAAELLAESRLLPVILPESREMQSAAWDATLALLGQLKGNSFALPFASLVRPYVQDQGYDRSELGELCRRLRFTNDEREAVLFVLKHEALIRQARSRAWPELQRVLIQRRARALAAFARAAATAEGGDLADVEFCEQKLQLPAEQLNPPPLVTGADLKRNGMRPGPDFKHILDAVRDAQLVGQVDTRADALALAKQLRDTTARS